jgi:hypothetical protein
MVSRRSRPRRRTIVLAAVDLHLVLVEHVPQVAGDQAQRQVFALRALEREGRIGQIAWYCTPSA